MGRIMPRPPPGWEGNHARRAEEGPGGRTDVVTLVLLGSLVEVIAVEGIIGIVGGELLAGCVNAAQAAYRLGRRAALSPSVSAPP